MVWISAEKAGQQRPAVGRNSNVVWNLKMQTYDTQSQTNRSLQARNVRPLGFPHAGPSAWNSLSGTVATPTPLKPFSGGYEKTFMTAWNYRTECIMGISRTMCYYKDMLTLIVFRHKKQ